MTTRQPKTPRQRAQEALGVANRHIKRLTTARDKHKAAQATIQAELATPPTKEHK